MKPGTRIITSRGERGIVRESDVLMRDARGLIRLAVKVDLDRGPRGAYRYQTDCREEI